MFFEIVENGVLINIRLSPNASALAIKGIFTDSEGNEHLKVGVLSPPEKGKANQELIKFLAKTTKIAKSNIMIVSGQLSHYKKVLLLGNKDYIVTQILLWGRENS